MRALLVFALLILNLLPIRAQDSLTCVNDNDKVQYYIDITVGALNQNTKDLYINPMIYSSTAPAFSVGFHAEKTGIQHYVKFQFAYNTFDWGKNSPEAAQYNLLLEYILGCNVLESSLGHLPVTISAGTGISTYLSFTNVTIPRQIDWYGYNDLSWYSANSLNAAVTAAINFSPEDKLSCRMSTSLFRLIGRPDAAHNFSQRNLKTADNFLHAFDELKAEYFWEKFSGSFTLEYRRSIRRNLSFLTGYNFFFASTELPREMRMYYMDYYAGISFHF